MTSKRWERISSQSLPVIAPGGFFCSEGVTDNPITLVLNLADIKIITKVPFHPILSKWLEAASPERSQIHMQLLFEQPADSRRMPIVIQFRCAGGPYSLSNNTSVKKSYGYKSSLILPGTSCWSCLPKRQQVLPSISASVWGILFKSQLYLEE